MLAREYLREHGYTKTSEALREEVGKGLERLELADNVDLGSVVREFEAYYAMRLPRRLGEVGARALRPCGGPARSVGPPASGERATYYTRWALVCGFGVVGTPLLA